MRSIVDRHRSRPARPNDGRDGIPDAKLAGGSEAGSSYAGGHVLVVGATDRRVKCVVCQVPLISGHENMQRLISSDLIASTRAIFDQEREARFKGKPPVMIKVVDPDPAAPSALPTPDSWAWFSETGKMRAPAWRNEVTLRSVEMFTEYEPGSYVRWIAPTPLLMVVAAGDHLVPADLTLATYDQALEPKKVVVLNGGHFDAYVKDFPAASGAARDWFV